MPITVGSHKLPVTPMAYEVIRAAHTRALTAGFQAVVVIGVSEEGVHIDAGYDSDSDLVRVALIGATLRAIEQLTPPQNKGL